MKKAALTFGLFSLVMVATSFATPQTSSTFSNNLELVNGKNNVDGDGVITGSVKGRKLDLHSNNNMSQKNFNQSEGFRQDRQSFGIAKKFD